MSRYQFIADHRQTAFVRGAGCTRERIFDWVRRIREIHEASRQTYGYARIHAELCEAGEQAGKHRMRV